MAQKNMYTNSAVRLILFMVNTFNVSYNFILPQQLYILSYHFHI